MFATLTLVDFGVIIGAALLTVFVAQYLGKPEKSDTNESPQSGTPSFEFDLSGALVLSNVEGANFLEGIGLKDPDWQAFRSAFSGRFVGLPKNVSADALQEVVTLAARSEIDPMVLEIEHHVAGIGLRLKYRNVATKPDIALCHSVLTSLPDLSLIKAVSETAPFPVWQSKSDGSVGWSNAFYQSLDRRVSSKDSQLFNLPVTQTSDGKSHRATIKDVANNRTHWFDVSRQRFEDGYVNFATDVHAVVKAETAQRNFVQTLAKTFAHLATGLAIFDRNRQLVLFNPSLFDLTELRPEFLTARPNLFSFFDQLRDNQIMPEPKNYANWRERIADVITAACDDNFSETWHLPNGLTYRVSGRPHPDGAIAFLFEDISAEISLTRRFRSEADVSRSAMDSLDQAIAIFNRAGFLQQSNTAMGQFIGPREQEELEKMSVRDVTRLCQCACKPSPVWGDIRDFVLEDSEREAWSAQLQNNDGQPFDLKVSPLASGASLMMLSPSIDISVISNRKPTRRTRVEPAKSAVA